MRILQLIFVFCLSSTIVAGQNDTNHHHDVYQWSWKKDGIVLGTSLASWTGSQYLKASADKITEADLPLRDPENLWSIDRGATNNNSQSAQNLSDVFLYSSFLLPFTHYSGKICRSQGLVVAGMALETFFINDASTNILKALTKRFRPYTYNPNVDLDIKLGRGARYSFVSGHASNTAALGFFSAKVFSDLYPHSKWKPVVWAFGITLPAMTGYLRYRAGKHFPTDIISGYLLGATIGYLVPHFHKTSGEHHSLSLLPANNGLLLSYQLTLK